MKTSARPAKRLVARLLYSSGALRRDLVRLRERAVAVNYHGTPACFAASLKRHLEFYSQYFECLDKDRLSRFIAGTYCPARPGIVLSFDDGLRNQATVAAPLLEEFGLTGWFMVPGAFVDTPSLDQPAFFRKHIRAAADAEHGLREDALAMSWGDVRALAASGHAIGCHTWNHRRLGAGVSEEEVRGEVVLARERIVEHIDQKVDTFCWVGGRPSDYAARAHRAVTQAYSFAFMSMSQAVRPGGDPHSIHRFNVEASYPLDLVRFQVSAFNEAVFAKRRRALEEILAPTSGPVEETSHGENRRRSGARDDGN